MRRGRSYQISLVFWLAVSSVSVLRPQTGNIFGVVADSVTRQRIPFANVTILNTRRGAASNNIGLYYIPKLPPGTYKVEASVIGYTGAIKEVSLKEGESLEVDFELAPASVEIHEVLVNAPRRRLELEVSTSVQVMHQRELKAVPVAAQQDLLQSLKVLPGIVSTSDVSSRFYVRGGEADQNLFLYDGIRIYYPFHALGIFSCFNPEVVENVEVYTGAFPPGFGDRLSSVVNILTRDGRADRMAARASVNFLSTEAEVEGPVFGNSSWLVDARRSMSSRTYSKIVGTDVPVSFYDATIKLTMKPGGVRKFDFTFLSSGDALRLPGSDQPNYSWRNNGFSISGSAVPTEQLYLQWLVFGSTYSADRETKSSKTIPPLSTSVKHYGVRTSATLYTSQNDMYYFGFEFGVPTMDYSFVNLLNVPQRITSTIVEPITWVRYLAKLGNLELDGGLHLEIGSLLYGASVSRDVQPRVNVNYLLRGTWRAKASFGRFTQHMVTVVSEDDIISLIDPWIRIPDNLSPEQADHYVVGVSGNLTEQSFLTLEAYYKHYGSLVAYNRDKIDATDPDYIEGTGNSYGAEIMLRSKIQWIDVLGAYSLSWAKLDNQGFVYFPRYDRRHHLNIMLIGRPVKGLSITLHWEYGSGFPFTQTIGYFDRLTLGGAIPGRFELETGSPYLMPGSKDAARLPAYHRLDANVHYDVSLLGFNISCGVDLLNVYDNKNIFYFDRVTGERVNMLPFYPSATLTVRY